jgi:putative phage-type endonuclease
MLTAEQRAVRKVHITGSDAAAIVGVNPDKGRLEVWAQKKGLLSDELEPSGPMERGIYLEPGAREYYREKTGYDVVEVGTILNEKYPLLAVTPDGAIGRITKIGPDSATDKFDRFAALEIKFPTFHTWHRWGAEGTDEVPEKYLPQGIWEAAGLDVPRTEFVVDLGDHFGLYTVKFDPEVFGQMYQICEKFWRDYVMTDVQPPPDGLDSEIETLKALFPRHENEQLIESTDELDALIVEYRAALARADDAETVAKAHKAKLMLTIGDAAGMKGPWGKIYYKNNKDSVKTDWERLARAMGADDDLISQYSETKTGARVFRPYWKK